MRTIGQARRDFRREGFAVIPRVFSTAECAALLREASALHASTSPDVVRVKNLSIRQRAGVSKAQAGEEIFIVGDLPRQSPRLARILADRRMTEVTGGVLGSAGLVYHFSNLTHKAAWVGPRIAWHRDFPNRYMSLSSARFCRVMVCLHGMSLRNGATSFQARSHNISDAKARRTQSRKIKPRIAGQTIKCPAGSIVLIHPKMVHGGGPNRSAAPRSVLIMQYGAAHCAPIAMEKERWTGRSPQEMRG